FNSALTEYFSVPTFTPVQTVSGISVAKRALVERAFDFVVVNSPVGEDVGIRFSIDTVTSCDSVVLFLAKTEQYDLAFEKLAEHGVFLLQKPISRPVFSIALDWLISAREGLRKNRTKTLSIEEKMNEIRLVNRAKWLLISELKMTEPTAHRYIEKQAMDRCIPRKMIAEEIIKTYG
ncbi:MAG: ANTAR domain-containing protein, partial [Clostridia bacterium]|nr:ANTAR domain-containing protein [Clostridia bacterium]